MTAIGEYAVAVATVRAEPSGRTTRVVVGTTLLDAVHQLVLPLGQSCDAVALCGFCRVTVLAGLANLEPPAAQEKKLLASLHSAPDERLACCARVLGDVTVTTTYW